MLDGNSVALRKEEQRIERIEKAQCVFAVELEDKLDALEILADEKSFLESKISLMQDELSDIREEMDNLQDSILGRADDDELDLTDFAQELIDEVS